MGRFHVAQRCGRRRHALERRDVAVLAQRLRTQDTFNEALRCELSAGGHDDPGLGHHLRRVGTLITTSLNIFAVRVVAPETCRGRSSPAATRSRVHVQGPTRRRRNSSPIAPRCSPKQRRNSATNRFRSHRVICRSLTPIGSVSTSDRAPIAGFANGSAVQLLPSHPARKIRVDRSRTHRRRDAGIRLDADRPADRRSLHLRAQRLGQRSARGSRKRGQAGPKAPGAGGCETDCQGRPRNGL